MPKPGPKPDEEDPIVIFGRPDVNRKDLDEIDRQNERAARIILGDPNLNQGLMAEWVKLWRRNHPGAALWHLAVEREKSIGERVAERKARARHHKKEVA